MATSPNNMHIEYKKKKEGRGKTRKNYEREEEKKLIQKITLTEYQNQVEKCRRSSLCECDIFLKHDVQVRLQNIVQDPMRKGVASEEIITGRWHST